MVENFVGDNNVSYSQLSTSLLYQSTSGNKDTMHQPEPDNFAEVLTNVDMGLAHTSEKLVNLDLYITRMSLCDNEAFTEVEIEKALILDVSFGYLDSEVRDLEKFLEILRKEIVDVFHKINLCRDRRDMLNVLLPTLHSSQSSWEHLQQQLSEVKKQMAKLQGNLSNFASRNYEDSTSPMLKLETPQEQKFVLRMLEKSLAAELDIEKKLLESEKSEEELKSKLFLANHVISCMEVAEEVTLMKLLENEYLAEVFRGTAKEMTHRLECIEFNLSCSIHRENELKSGLQICLNQLNDKETALETLLEMENAIQSLQERVFMAETRAHDAEAQLTAVTEENLELKEEMGFLKGGDDNGEKISLLEKRVHDMEIELQHAKASSDASQEQQNMLYSAIWDMETLIEDLKSKVLKAESRADNAEEQCLVLAENNLDLNREVSYHKSRVEDLERSLNEANEGKVGMVKEVNVGVKFIADMVMQLAAERERIQSQMYSFARENKILLDELRRIGKNGSMRRRVDKEDDDRESVSTVNDPATATNVTPAARDLEEEPPSTSNQVDELSEYNHRSESKEGSSEFVCDKANALNGENEGKKNTGFRNGRKAFIFMAGFVLVLSVLAMNISYFELIFSTVRHQLGLL